MDNLLFKEEFYSFARSAQDPVAGGILVSRVIDESAEERWIKDEFERLASSFVAEKKDARGLSKYLRELGFGGAKDYFRRENSSLNYVLVNRRGIPISLALVVMGVGRLLGLAIDGINYPGHFLAKVEGSLIDPFNLRVFNKKETQGPPVDQAYDVRQEDWAVASGSDIVIRMLNNLRQIASDERDYAAALDYCSYQLILAKEPFPVYVERVSLWLASGVKEMALHDLEHSIRCAPNSEVRAKLEDHRLTIESTPSKLH